MPQLNQIRCLLSLHQCQIGWIVVRKVLVTEKAMQESATKSLVPSIIALAALLLSAGTPESLQQLLVHFSGGLERSLSQSPYGVLCANLSAGLSRNALASMRPLHIQVDSPGPDL